MYSGLMFNTYYTSTIIPIILYANRYTGGTIQLIKYILLIIYTITSHFDNIPYKLKYLVEKNITIYL